MPAFGQARARGKFKELTWADVPLLGSSKSRNQRPREYKAGSPRAQESSPLQSLTSVAFFFFLQAKSMAAFELLTSYLVEPLLLTPTQ